MSFQQNFHIFNKFLEDFVPDKNINEVHYIRSLISNK